jgi:hypothetical protein
MTTPFFNTGGAAFTDMRCVGIRGVARCRDAQWTQSYSLTFEMKASDWLAGIMRTVAGELKSAPLEPIGVRLGFYPRDDVEPYTVDATVSVKILPGRDFASVQIVAAVEQVRDDNAEVVPLLTVLAPWLNVRGAVILRPVRCEDTIDMFEDGKIPPLTLHSPWNDPVVTDATGDALLALLHEGFVDDDEDSDPDVFVGSAEGDDE